MSNYIKVLRRLEQTRRNPAIESEPVQIARVPVTPPPAPVDDLSASATHVERAPLPPPPPLAPPASRTVIQMPVAPTPVAPMPVAPAPIVPEPTPVVAPPVVRPEPRRTLTLSSTAHPGIATLLDNIRMLASGRATRVVVFCGASTAEAVETLAFDLAEHAERSGMRTLVARLTRTAGRTVIAPTRTATPDAPALEVGLDAGTSSAELHAWIARIAPRDELIVITGPPLADSVDAALLACGCEGLVIVAESEVTERAALQLAAERARIAGCRTLGVVMNHTKDHLPGWVRRIVGDHPEPHLPRED